LIVQRPVNRKYKMKRKIEKTMTKISSYQNVINGAPEFGTINHYLIERKYIHIRLNAPYH
jgi:hypothetical protein